MAAKLDYSKWDLEINGSLPSRKASEAIEARTGDKVSHVQINNERKRRKIGSASTVETSPKVKVVSPMVEVKTSEDETPLEGEQLTILGVELSPQRPSKEAIRSTLAGVEAVANPQQVEQARQIVGGLMDLDAVAVALGITKRSALVYVREGRLKALKVGAKWKVSPDNLKRFIDGI